MKPPRVPERVVQRQIVALLRSLGGLVWVLGTTRRRGDYQGTMQTPGLPDLIAAIKGRMLMVECKAKGGRLTDDQLVFRAFCLDCGVAHVVGGVDEVLAWLQQQGIVKPDAVPWYRQDGATAESPILAARRRPGAAQIQDASITPSGASVSLRGRQRPAKGM